MKKKYFPLIIKLRLLDDVDIVSASPPLGSNEGGETLPPWFLGTWTGT